MKKGVLIFLGLVVATSAQQAISSGCLAAFCMQGTKCEDVPVNCIRAPCPSQIQCVPINGGVRPGCPVLPPGTIGICISECSTDAQCRDGTSCCKNGCGTVCMGPSQPAPDVVVPPAPVDPVTSSECPASVSSFFSWRSRQCSADAHCWRAQKCCSTSNGMRCLFARNTARRPNNGGSRRPNFWRFPRMPPRWQGITNVEAPMPIG